MFEKLEALCSEVQNEHNIYEIAEKLSGLILEEFQAEVCEIKYLEENRIFSRIHCAVREKCGINHDQSKVEELFGIKKTPADNSIIGYCIEQGKDYLWVADEVDFYGWVNRKRKKPVYKASAMRYMHNMPSGSINNFVIFPIVIPSDNRKNAIYDVKLCIHVYNLCNATIDRDKLDICHKEIRKAFNYISVILLNGIFYVRARNEIHINRKIVEITTEAENIENFLESIVDEFAKRLRTPLTTIWFPDHKLQVLVLHSFHIKIQYLAQNKNVKEFQIRETIERWAAKILKVDDCVIGSIFKNRDLPWIKSNDICKEANVKSQYKWGVVCNAIGTSQFIALPIRDRNGLIAIIVLHPNVCESEFVKIPLSYFRSFTSQAATALRAFISRSFSDKVKLLSEKLTPLVKKREDIFYNELVFIIKDVIEAEACSLFEVRGGDSRDRGVYLKASSDIRDKVKGRIGTKIYEIDNKSITGYVALTGEPIIVYDVERVNEFIPEIDGMSKNFMDHTTSPLHISYIAVPIPVGQQNYDDRRTSVMILRCINKKKTADRTLTGIFSVDDKHLLKYVAVVLESFTQILKVLYERNDLIDLIIHEIENPIVSIRGKVDIIEAENKKKDLLGEGIIKKLRDIDEMASFLKGWASNIGLLNQLMQGQKLSCHPEWIRLWDDVIEHVIFWMSPALRTNGIEPSDIEMKGLGFPMKVYVDKDHLRQVFYNLLSNAFKYKKRSKKPKVFIELEERETEMVVKIEDWGVGTCMDDEDQIFKMGIRGDYAKKSSIKGKGFGLWLCKELLESNGFGIRLAKCFDPTCFEVLIPFKCCDY